MGKTIAVLMLAVWTVSPSVRADGRYFTDAAGKTWVPVGLNICFSRTKDGEPTGQTLDERRAELEGWISALAANGGNYVRLWLGHEFFEVMPEKPGDFDPVRTETARLRIYGLRGRKTTVLWCRDKTCDWRSELVEEKAAETVTGEKLPFWNRTFRCYLPWEDREVEASAPALPPFRRSIVVRFPTAELFLSGVSRFLSD